MVLRANVTPVEGNKLLGLIRRTRSVVTLRRGQVVLHSAQGFAAPRIAELLGLSPDYVRTIIKEWNEEGFPALEPKYGGGRPKTFTDEVRKELAALATSRPKDLGLPFQEWSLSRLQREAMRRGIVPTISEEWLRVILHEEALSFQEAKTWKESKDPNFAAKKKRIEKLLRKRHNPPVVVALDEMGPVNMVPRKGRSWRREGRPHRVRAEYHKNAGVRYWFGAYHVGGDRLWGRLERRKGGKAWLRFLKSVRARFPREHRVYVIQDNLSAHWTDEIEAWARANKMVLVPTATNASWMNPIECRFAELEDLALNGTDFRSWGEVGRALRRGADYRNRKRLPVRRWKVGRPLWTRH